jgi:hypothetical protein
MSLIAVEWMVVHSSKRKKQVVTSAPPSIRVSSHYQTILESTFDLREPDQPSRTSNSDFECASSCKQED